MQITLGQIPKLSTISSQITKIATVANYVSESLVVGAIHFL